MRIAFFLFIILWILFIPLYPVYAQDLITAKDSSPSTASSSNTEEFKRNSSTLLKPLTPAERLEKNRENLMEKKENIHEKIATKEAALKEKLSKFKDKTKAQILERINQDLNKINQKITNEMTQHLKRLTSILDKLKDRLDKSTVADKEGAENAIASAKESIDSALEIVQTQAEKDYSLNITTESKSREAAKSTRDSLHTDLKIAIDAVKQARQAVIEAIRITATAMKGATNGEQ